VVFVGDVCVSQVQGPAVYVCGSRWCCSAAMTLCGCVAVWLCGCVAVCVCVALSLWLCVCVGSASALEKGEASTREDSIRKTETQLTDNALFAFLKIMVDIESSNQRGALREYSLNPRIRQRFPHGFKVQMGFGLHFGWAIEGTCRPIVPLALVKARDCPGYPFVPLCQVQPPSHCASPPFDPFPNTPPSRCGRPRCSCCPQFYFQVPLDLGSRLTPRTCLPT
jgi:hypothetical protein